MSSLNAPLLMRAAISVCLVIGACSAVASTEAPQRRPAITVDQDFAQLNHTVFTPRDGAPAEIIDIIEGHDGYLWLGTSVGLTRFDGVRFDHNPIPDFPRQGVYTVKSEDNGDLWAGFLTGGVAYIHENHVTLLDEKNIPRGTIFDIFRMKDGVLWIVGSRGITRQTVEGRWERVDASMGYEPSQPSAATHKADGSVLILDKGRVYAIAPGERTFHEVPYDDFVREDFEIEEASRWRPHEDEYGIRDWAGTHWIVTAKGIDRYHWRADGTPRIEHIGKNEGLTSDTVNGIYKDDSGNVWVRTDLGLERFRPNRVTRLLVPGDTTNPSIERDATSGIWFTAGERDVLYHATRDRLTSVDAHSAIGAIFRAPDGTIWAAGTDGVEFTKDGKRGRIPLPNEAAKVPVRAFQSFAVDRDNSVWVGMVRFGTFSWSAGQWKLVIPPEQYGPVLMDQDPHGRLWSIYARNRITVTDGKDVQTFDSTHNVDVGYLLALDVDGPNVWIGGRNGIQFLRAGRFESLTTGEQDSLTGISGLALTPSGDLWANGDRGLALIGHDDIAASLRDSAHINHVQWFDFNDGIEGSPSQFRPLPTLERSPDGRIWATTNQGVFWIDPDSFKPDQRKLAAQVIALIADGKNIDLRGKAELPEFTHAVQIDYTSPDLSMAQRLRFRYRLEGVDTTWQDAGDRRSAFYTALSPGEYSFHLIVANADGVWGDDHQVATFRLLPGWYQTLWFKVACVLFGAVVIGGGLTLRDRRATLRRQVRMAERERIARELHDTLLQGTQGLIYHVGSALKQASEPALRITLIDAMERAQDALVEARERVNVLRDDDRTPVDFVELLRLASKTITHGHEVYFHLEVEGSPKLLGASAAAELATVCQEALSNVVAHAAAQSILLTVSFSRRWLTISIADDGAGIDETIMRAGGREGHWGLLGMRERVDIFQGRIEIQPRTGGGTMVTIRVRGPSVYAR